MHKRSQTGEKPFGCTQCDNTFPHSSTLKTILKTHTGEELYQGIHLKMHMGIHTDVNFTMQLVCY